MSVLLEKKEILISSKSNTESMSEYAFRIATELANIFDYQILSDLTYEDPNQVYGNIYYIGNEYPRLAIGQLRNSNSSYSDYVTVYPVNRYCNVPMETNSDYRVQADSRYAYDSISFIGRYNGIIKYIKSTNFCAILNFTSSSYSTINYVPDFSSLNFPIMLKINTIDSDDESFIFNGRINDGNIYNISVDVGTFGHGNSCIYLFRMPHSVANTIWGLSDINNSQYIVPIMCEGYKFKNGYLYTNIYNYPIGKEVKINNETYVILSKESGYMSLLVKI